MNPLDRLRHRAAIGVEVGAAELRLVQVGSGGAVESVVMDRVAAEVGEDGWPGVAECQRIAGVIARRRFRGKTVVLSVPQHACRFAEVEGVGGADEASRVVAAGRAAAAAGGFEPGDYSLAATPVAGGTRRMLVRGCRRKPLMDCCAAFLAAGLDVSSVRTRADAIAAAADTPAATAWLDLATGSRVDSEEVDATRAVLVVVEAGMARYARPVRTAMPLRLGMVSPAVAEAVTAELLPGIRHAEGRCTADQVALLTATVPMSGDPAVAVEAFVSGLRGRMELERGGLGEPRPLGLAESLGRATEASVELLPHAHLARRRQLAICRSMLGAAAGYAALVTLLVAVMTVGRPAPAGASPGDRLESSVESAASRTRDSEREIGLLEAQADELAAAAAAAAATADRPDWRRLLDRLAADAGDAVQLTEIEVAPRAGDALSIRIDGQTSDPRSAWDFALALERGGLFDQVDLARTRRLSVRPGADVVFQVNLRLLPLAPSPVAEAAP